MAKVNPVFGDTGENKNARRRPWSVLGFTESGRNGVLDWDEFDTTPLRDIFVHVAKIRDCGFLASFSRAMLG